MIITVPVEGRRGWEWLDPIIEAGETRRAVFHRASNVGLWVWAADYPAQLAAAHEVIDGLYEERWQSMAELIQTGDLMGPNVWLVESGGGRVSAAAP